MKNSHCAACNRNFRLGKSKSVQNQNLWYLLFWPLYILRYALVEAMNPAVGYHVIYTPLDDLIPFYEGFLIPYILWYGEIVLMHLYTLLYDVEAFKKYSRFLIICITISTTVFLLFPSCQNLRPSVFPRDNFLTSAVKLLYRVDTSTNVLPSEHAIGAMAVFAAALNIKRLHTLGRLALIGALTVLICLSTVFLKQHSVLDVAAAVPVCAFAYWIVYGRKEENGRAVLQESNM